MSAEEIAALSFDNRFTRELPGDPETANFCRQVQGACYSRVLPASVVKPELVAYAYEVAQILDLTPAACEQAEFAEVFAGNRQLQGMDPYATCYGGHQFGNWARILELEQEAKVLGLKPEDPREWFIFIEAYRRLGRLEEAEQLNSRVNS